MIVKPSELQILLAASIRKRKSVLVVGSPGIGKSDLIAQSATDADAALILDHPQLKEPVDFCGLPWPRPSTNGTPSRADFIPIGSLAEALAATRLTVWFMDDVGQSQPSVQAATMQLLLAREVNGHKLPPDVVIMAATNRRTDRAGVTGILETVKSRFLTIVELKTDLEDWLIWALRHHMPPHMLSFMRYRPDLLNAFEAKADLTNSPTPRTWSHVATIEEMNLPPNVERAAISGAVGEGAATEYEGYRQMYRSLPDADEIIRHPDTAPIPNQTSVLYATGTSLAYRADADNFGAIVTYCQRLADAKLGEFGTFIIRDSERRSPEITHTSAYAQMIVTPLGAQVNGL